MTYDELVAAVLAWVNKPEIEPQIPAFIALAEAQMNRVLTDAGVAGATRQATLLITSGTFNAPADLARPEQLVISGQPPLTNVTPQAFEALAAETGPASNGRPTLFGVCGAQIRVWPVPDGPYGATLTYQARPPALGPGNPSNWALANHPDIYLYGTLAQTAPFLGEDARLATWGGLFVQALDAAVAAERARRGSQKTPAYRPHIPFHPSRSPEQP